ncbi:MAG: hypothetical protein LBC14_07815 [Desulfovibrio sp.]|jgi:hypothetical protein|nr:hypothetical protein [Desulfovibrio sp.]
MGPYSLHKRSEYGKGSAFKAALIQAVADRTPMGNITDAAARAEIQRVTFTAPEAEVPVVDDVAGNLPVAEGLLTPYRMRVAGILPLPLPGSAVCISI